MPPPVATRRTHLLLALFRLVSVRRVLVTLAAAACVVTLLPSASQATPPQSIAAVARQLDRLQNQAEAASERYNAAQIRVATAKGALTRVQAKVAKAQARLDVLNASIGSLISTLYRTDAGGSSLTLLSASSPQTYLMESAAVQSLARQRSEILRRVEIARQEITTDQLAAVQKLGLVKTAEADAAKAKADIAKQVKAQKKLLASLKAAQLAKLRAAQAAAAKAAERRAQASQRSTRSGPSLTLPKNLGNASPRAIKALQYALAQIGKPYIYAADGPGAFDCSGLTMAAYRTVGIYLPHQSEMQWNYGRHVSSSELQPGDLVFYYTPMHHVAMYVGNGMIVHAANPNEGVLEAPVFSMPYDGAVRLA